MKIKLLVSIIIVLLMTSCTQVIVSDYDEIRMNTWTAKTENGSTVRLSFKDDIAELKLENNNRELLSLKGLCTADGKKLMIYNQSEGEPYFFEYKINNNTLTLKYNGGSIKLIR